MGIAWFFTRIVKPTDKGEFLTWNEVAKKRRWSLLTPSTGLMFFRYHGTSGGNGAMGGGESSDTICRACVFPLSWDGWRVIGSAFISQKCRRLVSGGRSDRQGLGYVDRNGFAGIVRVACFSSLVWMGRVQGWWRTMLCGTYF